MQRINRILKNDLYKECIAEISDWEKKRRFCRHDTNHFLNVARISMILNQEKQLEISKEWIYAAALLHDVGRHIQYKNGTDHAAASAKIAPEILRESGFSEDEIHVITDAIENHRNAKVAEGDNLRGILYRADKLSRECYFCKVEKKCDWKKEKKNLELFI